MVSVYWFSTKNPSIETLEGSESRIGISWTVDYCSQKPISVSIRDLERRVQSLLPWRNVHIVTDAKDSHFLVDTSRTTRRIRCGRHRVDVLSNCEFQDACTHLAGGVGIALETALYP